MATNPTLPAATQRPKYKQHSKIKMVDVPGDPDHDKSLRVNPTSTPRLPPTLEKAAERLPTTRKAIEQLPRRPVGRAVMRFVPLDSSSPDFRQTPAFNQARHHTQPEVHSQTQSDKQTPVFTPRASAVRQDEHIVVPGVQIAQPEPNAVYQPRQPAAVMSPPVAPFVVHVPIPVDPRRRLQASTANDHLPGIHHDSVCFSAFVASGNGEDSFPMDAALVEDTPDSGYIVKSLLGAHMDGTKRKIMLQQVEVPLTELLLGLQYWVPIARASLHAPPNLAARLLKALAGEQGHSRMAVCWFDEVDPSLRTGALSTFALLIMPLNSPLATKLECRQGPLSAVIIRRGSDRPSLLLPNPLSSRFSATLPAEVESDLIHSPDPGDRAIAMYGFRTDFFECCEGKVCMVYAPKGINTDYRFPTIAPIWSHFVTGGAIPSTGSSLHGIVIIPNAMMNNFTHSSLGYACFSARTSFYSYGPALDVSPQLWQLRPIWERGALVTFSPAFLLRHPKQLASILRDINSCKTWDAYVIPPVIRYCNSSFGVVRRCPDPKRTILALTNAVGMDNTLYQVSGDLTGSKSMAITTAPPKSIDTEGRKQWLNRQIHVERLEEWEDVVKHCEGVWPATYPKPAWDEPDFVVGDLESAQLADLHAMMFRPDAIPYRRYIYIGNMSAPKKVELYRGVEIMNLGDFHAALAAAV